MITQQNIRGAINGSIVSHKQALPKREADIFAGRVACELMRGNFTAARTVIDEAEEASKELGGRSAADKLDLPLEDVGIGVSTAMALNNAGIFTARDLEDETESTLLDINQISRTRARRVMQVVRGLCDAAGK